MYTTRAACTPGQSRGFSRYGSMPGKIMLTVPSYDPEERPHPTRLVEASSRPCGTLRAQVFVHLLARLKDLAAGVIAQHLVQRALGRFPSFEDDEHVGG